MNLLKGPRSRKPFGDLNNQKKMHMLMKVSLIPFTYYLHAYPSIWVSDVQSDLRTYSTYGGLPSHTSIMNILLLGQLKTLSRYFCSFCMCTVQIQASQHTLHVKSITTVVSLERYLSTCILDDKSPFFPYSTCHTY